MSKYLTDPSQVVAGTTIRSDKYNSDIQAIGVGFEGVEADMLKNLRMPSTFSGNNIIPSVSVENTFLYVNGEGDITLYNAAALQTQFIEVATAAGQANTSAANASTSAGQASASASTAETSRVGAVSAALTSSTSSALAQKWATEAPNVPVITGLFSARHWAGRAQFFAGEAQALVEGDFATNNRANEIDDKVTAANVRIGLAEDATVAVNLRVDTQRDRVDAVQIRANTIEQLAIIGL